MAQNARRKRSCLTCARFTSRGSLMWLCLLVMAWSSSSWRLFSSPDESSVGMYARVRYSTSSTVLPAFATPEPESTTPVEYPAKVTCGSVIKVLNKSMKLYLRSQEIQYGSGSGMQTVTAFDIAEEAFNYWVRSSLSCPFSSLSLSLSRFSSSLDAFSRGAYYYCDLHYAATDSFSLSLSLSLSASLCICVRTRHTTTRPSTA